jgi:hypothetical protein
MSCVLHQSHTVNITAYKILTFLNLTSLQTANDMPDVITYVGLPKFYAPTTTQDCNLSLRLKHHVMMT